jgi:hypothetical protein
MATEEQLKRIVFFNGHQNGDVANSRGLVDYITKELGDVYEYYFLTLRTELGSKGAVRFGDNINIHNPIVQGLLPFMPPQWNPDIKTAHERGDIYFVYGDTLFLNVWIGCSHYYMSHRSPRGGGITRESLRQQICEVIDVIHQAGGPILPYPTDIESLSSRTTNPHNKQLVDDFLEELHKKYKKMVLICNGPVLSSQTPQFSFGNILQDTMQANEDIAFVFTDKNFVTNNSNCFFTDDHFPVPNLSEIDYLSKDCEVIVSRMSGPGIITMNRDNYLDSTKTLISFTLQPNIAFEALGSDSEIENRKWASPQGATMVWSNDMNESSIKNTIEQYI